MARANKGEYMKTIIRNVEILTMDANNTMLQGDLAFDGQKIAYIGEVPSHFTCDREIDGTGKLAMPGMINAHTHISMSLFRNYADDLPFWPWLTEKIWPAEAKLRAEDVYYGAVLSIAEMIRFGVTTYADMYFFMDEVAKATKETGIRANLSRGLVGSPVDGEQKLAEAIAFHKEWHETTDGRIRVDFAPHAPYTCDPDYLKRIMEETKTLNPRIHIHLSETTKEVADNKETYGKSPIKHVADIGLFDYPTMAAHCVHVDEEDLEILASKGVSVVTNPSSNLKLGNGAAPVKRMLELGINVALGTDGSSSNNNLNLFEEMHLAALLAKGFSGDTTAVPAETALRMATINGAKALGIDHLVGSIEVGKCADVILVDMEQPHCYPKYHSPSNLVYSSQASDVDTVFVNGEMLMEGRKLLTIDFKEIAAKAQESALYLTKTEA